MNSNANDEKYHMYLDSLCERYPRLWECMGNIESAYKCLVSAYAAGGKVLVAGNGGSASDAEHIVSELMKTFKLTRKLQTDLVDKLRAVDDNRGNDMADTLGESLPAISLVSQTSLFTAFTNDVGAEGVFAQQVLGYGRPGDVLWVLSTSGNSDNILNAVVMAKALGLKVIGMTGQTGGQLADYADIIIKVPEIETYKVQELHLPVYHCLCAMLEEAFFG